MGKPYSQVLRERVIAAVDTDWRLCGSIEALIAALAETLTKVSPQECENYFANQGYRRQL